MTDLWFEKELDDVARRGTMLYASRPGEVWAVLLQELVYTDDLTQESDQLLGHYGAAVHGIGHLLLGGDVQLPPGFLEWATVPNVPMAQLGSWIPCLVAIDGVAQLAVSRDFDGVRAFATTLAGEHLTIVAPSSESMVTLVHRSDLDAPPPGKDHLGGGG